MARTASIMAVASPFLLSCLLTLTVAAPHTEANTKKLMRKDSAEPGGEALQKSGIVIDTNKKRVRKVATRGATISQHQRLDSKPGVEKSSPPRQNTKELGSGAGEEDGEDDEGEHDEGEDNEFEREEKNQAAEEVTRREADSAENKVTDGAQVTCDDMNTNEGKDDCMGPTKCGDTENATWQLQCGYGSVTRIDNVCVYKSQDEQLTKEKCGASGELGHKVRGLLFCHEEDLFLTCGKSGDFKSIANRRKRIESEANEGEGEEREGDEHEGEDDEEEEVDGEDLASQLAAQQHITEEELHAPIQIIDYFENLVKDKDLKYEEDPEKANTCKSTANHTFEHDGKTFTISVGLVQDKPAEDKKCNRSTLIPSSVEAGETQAFEHGRLALCAMYVATAPFCGINFYMTKDYHCYCSNGEGCDYETESGACVYILNEMGEVRGAPPTLEDIQERVVHQDAYGEALERDHKEHPGDIGEEEGSE